MSRHNDSIIVPISNEKAMLVCKEAASNLNWRIMNEGKNFISCKEITSFSAFSVTWPAKVDISISEHNDKVQIKLEGSIAGLGPIQSGHLKGQLGKFKNLIEVAINRLTQNSNINNDTPSLSSEIEKLSVLHSKGILTKEEFDSAKKKILEQL